MANTSEVGGSLFRKPRQTKILRSELRQLVEMLEMQEVSVTRFGQEVLRHPSVLKAILRAANSSLTGSAVEITDPAHATLFLGSRRVAFLLNTLPPEIVEEDSPETTN